MTHHKGSLLTVKLKWLFLVKATYVGDDGVTESALGFSVSQASRRLGYKLTK